MRDADVRKAVINSLSVAHAGDACTRIVQEMGVWSGSVRVDVAVINGHLHGWELKSDSDDLSRLPNQAQIYSRVFDLVTLVVGRKHSDKSIPLVPEWWTVIEASMPAENVDLKVIRQGRENPQPDPYLIANLLWKSEALKILEAHDLARGWRSKPIQQIHERLARELDLSTLKDAVRAVLKDRAA